MEKLAREDTGARGGRGNAHGCLGFWERREALTLASCEEETRGYFLRQRACPEQSLTSEAFTNWQLRPVAPGQAKVCDGI